MEDGNKTHFVCAAFNRSFQYPHTSASPFLSNQVRLSFVFLPLKVLGMTNPHQNNITCMPIDYAHSMAHSSSDWKIQITRQ